MGREVVVAALLTAVGLTAPTAHAAPATTPAHSVTYADLAPHAASSATPPAPPERGTVPAAPSDGLADTGAGVLPWLAAAGAAALGVGAVVFAVARRRTE